jgi:predicted nucleotidyltransferase component of viral defense system
VTGGGREEALDESRNLVRSVHQRLVNHARAGHEEAQAVFTRYGQERLLYRLAQSPHQERFVLEGAALFRLWEEDLHRPTLDLDLLAYGESAVDHLVAVFREVCVQPVEADGLLFPPERIRGEPIREDVEYRGVRLHLLAMLGGARIPLRVDAGFGDTVLPAPQWAVYPALLEMPAAVLRAYPKEAVVAEKFHVILARGLLNSRLKDYYDLWNLARHSAFNGETLATAMEATFGLRKTALPENVPAALTDRFYDDPAKQRAWSAFLARNRLQADAPALPTIVNFIAGFVMPPASALSRGDRFRLIWPPDGPWRKAG